MALRGVILDMGGTLALSNDAHAPAWVEAFHELAGKPRGAPGRLTAGRGAATPASLPRA